MRVVLCQSRASGPLDDKGKELSKRKYMMPSCLFEGIVLVKSGSKWVI
jgi:hypothetical protein